LELARLAAAVVGVEGEGTVFQPFQEHDARIRCAFGADGGERHRVRQRQARLHRILEPGGEKPQRIGAGVLLREAGAHVFLSQFSDVH
jgi:hypothetical protein